MSLEAFSFQAFFNGMKKMSATLFQIFKAWPTMMLNLLETMINTTVGVLTYHIFSLPSKPLHNEVVLIVGYDNLLGMAFATEVVKMNGTVVLLDKDKEKGEEFAKSLVTMVKDNRAFFQECDVTKLESVKTAIDTITKNLDVTILLNCTMDHLVSTYFNIYKLIYPIMKGNGTNGKGRLVFFRTMNFENRNAVQSLYEGINKDLKVQNVEGVSTVVAHIYPKISSDEENHVFGHITPESLATEVLVGVSKNRRDIWIPGHMVYFGWWLKCMPSGFTSVLDNFLFGDK